MAFVADQGWEVKKTPTAAAVTYTRSMFIVNNATNDVPVTVTSQYSLRGIALEAKASSAATTSIHIHVPTSPSSTFYGDMTTGEVLAATDVGKSFDFAADGLTVSTNNTYRPIKLMQFISTTKGLFAIDFTSGIEN